MGLSRLTNWSVMQRTGVALIAATCCSVAAASAQQTNCADPRTRVERLICADDGLRALDADVANAYLESLKLAESSPGAEVQQQYRWLQERNRCDRQRDDTDRVACLRDSYRSRIDAVRLRLAQLTDERRTTEEQAQTAIPAEPPSEADIAALESVPGAQQDERAEPSETAPNGIADTSVAPTISSQTQPPSVEVDELTGGQILALFYLLGFVVLSVFLIPTFIAFSRRHRNRWVIMVLNVGLGATVIGWLAALIWALNKMDDPVKGGERYDPVL